MAGSTLPERVAQIYYTYGLFCSSYPVTAITFALSIILTCCFPLLNVPLPGNVPTVVNLPLNSNNDYQSHTECGTKSCLASDLPLQMELLHNETQKLPYIWVKDKPLLYVHQIIIKIGVSPWSNSLKMWDAYRAPLQEVFRLLETVRNHEDPESKETLLRHCYQIEGIKKHDSKESIERVLPEYGCLLLSPANLWQQNLQSFSLDANIVNTVYNYQSLQMGKASVAEMAFGLHLRDTGIKRYPLRSRPRVLQYAVTIFYQQADQRFIHSLTNKLKEMYPLYQDAAQSHADEVTLVYYPGQFNYHELVPLTITFIGLFLYVYFSVRKIEFIKSKLGLAACAVVTVAGSLSMSMGICFYFGFSLSLQGKEIFPYLVIILGLENVLVLTKSVTSTDSRLDVKIRLAQGLSKEGWSITKNLLTELTILTVSFFTFVPFIQEFSIFMIVSLISDYFVQMVLFATILGIDVRRMEHFPEKDKKEYFNANNTSYWRFNRLNLDESSVTPTKMTKSKSHPRLNGLAQNIPTDVVAQRNSSPTFQDKVPKRIRLVNMWARTRFFQRAFMVWMLVWISMIMYNSGVVDYFISNVDKTESNVENVKGANEKEQPKESTYMIYNSSGRQPLVFSPLIEVTDTEKTDVDANHTIFLKHSPHSRPWSRLSPYHWSAILSQYNESLAGRYIVVLPPALVSHRVAPELAAGLRHPDERDPPPLRWQALAAALDPIDILPEFDIIESKSQSHQWGKGAELPIYPTTPMEILLLAILCAISVAVIAYMMVVLYRCVCSRHYAEWRASWNNEEEYRKIIARQPEIQLVLEAVPLVVEGHSQEVECLVTDGERVVSSSLQGNMKMWDSQNGEIITKIDRRKYLRLQAELLQKVNSKTRSSPGYEAVVTEFAECSHSSPIQLSSNQGGHRLRKGLSNHLSGLRFRSTGREQPPSVSRAERTKYDLDKTYRDLYYDDQRDDLYEAKENVDINNLKNSNGEVFGENLLNDLNSLRHRYENKYVNRRMSIIGHEMDVFHDPGWGSKPITESPVWSMDFCNDLIILGCRDGRLEFWAPSSGKLMCVWWGPEGAVGSTGVTHVKAIERSQRVCTATLSGHLTLLRLDAYNVQSGAQVDWRFSTAHRRTHKRTGSADSLHSAQGLNYCDTEQIICVRLAHCRPHQQPILELQSEGGRILTGGQDHVLKIFSSTDLKALFTLHGHCGPITSSFIDHATPTIAGSGSQDGLLCVWDLHTGACLYSMQAHHGTVSSLAYTASYVISAGGDERLCIWDRFQGHMLNSIHIGINYMSRMLPLTHTLLVLGDRSGLTAYDLSNGEVLRRVLFGKNEGGIYVRQIVPLKDAIVCDYANQLRIVRFPRVSRLNMKGD